MTAIEEKYFRDSDLILICALVILGFKIDSIDVSNPQRVIFSIKRTEGLDKALKLYWNNELRVSPKDFGNNLKNLKTQIRTEIAYRKGVHD